MGGRAAGSSNGVMCPEEEEAGAGSRSGQKVCTLIQAPDNGTGRERVHICPHGGRIQVPHDVLKASQLEMFTLFGL